MQIKEFKSYKATFALSEVIEWNKSHESSDDQIIEIKFYKDNEYKFSLEKKLHTDNEIVFIEWLEYENKIYVVINTLNSSLSIFDANSMELLHCIDNGIFLSGYKILDNSEYLYTWGWSNYENTILPMRTVSHIPSLLKNPAYQPKKINCLDVKEENFLNPGMNLFGCDQCKAFLDKYDKIFDKVSMECRTERFNENLQSDTLLRRFIEIDGLVDFESNDSKQLLEKIMMNQRSMFNIKVYNNASGERQDVYDYALFTKLDSKYEDFNYVVADKLFHSIDGLPFNEINLRFEIYTDQGHLCIHIFNQLTQCDKIKNMHDGVIPDFFKNHVNKIDPESKMKIHVNNNPSDI